MGKREAAVPVPFYVCRRPDFDEVLDDCDRPLLEWIESVSSDLRTPPMTREREHIITETNNARDSALAQCEAGRYASGDEDDGEPHLHVAITSRLDGQRSRSSATTGDSNPSAQVTVSFSPAPCAPVPFEVLHRVAEVGVNHHAGAIEGEWRGAEAPQPNGIGVFSGGYVVSAWEEAVSFAAILLNWLRPAASFRSRPQPPLFSAWATHERFPDVPDDLLDRCDAYDSDRVHIDLDPGAAYIRYRVELCNLTTGVTYSTADIVRYLSSSDLGAGEGGLVLHADLPYSVGVGGSFPMLRAPEDVAGEWLVRVGLLGVGVPGGSVQVKYGGKLWADGVWQHLPLVGTPIPSYAAVAEGYLGGRVWAIPVRGVGGAILGFDSVPGVGVIARVVLTNPAPVAACVVADLFRSARIVRGLGAGATSAPVSILMPLNFDEASDRVAGVSYFGRVVAPAGAMPDGCISGPLPDIPEGWPPRLYFSTDGISIHPDLFYLPGSRDAVTSGYVTWPLRLAPAAPDNWTSELRVTVRCLGEYAVAGKPEDVWMTLHVAHMRRPSYYTRQIGCRKVLVAGGSLEFVPLEEPVQDRYQVAGVGESRMDYFYMGNASWVELPSGAQFVSGMYDTYRGRWEEGPFYKDLEDVYTLPIWTDLVVPYEFTIHVSATDFRRFYGDTVSVNLADAKRIVAGGSSANHVAFGSWSGGDVDTLVETVVQDYFEQRADRYRNMTVVEVVEYCPLIVYRQPSGYGPPSDYGAQFAYQELAPGGSAVVDLT